jgi:hypothetical protein
MNSSNSNRFNPSQSNMKKTGLSSKNMEDPYMGSNLGKLKFKIKDLWVKVEKTSESTHPMRLV